MEFNNDTVLMVYRSRYFIYRYYYDGRMTISKEKINKYYVKNIAYKRYKRPIEMNGFILYPTRNVRENDCFWINIAVFGRNHQYFDSLIKKYDLYDKVFQLYYNNKYNIHLSIKEVDYFD